MTAGVFGRDFDDREGSGTSSGTKSFGIMMGGGGERALGAAGFLALEPFGSFPGIADRSYLAGRYVGVVLHGVEAQRVPVRVGHLGQDPAQAGPVHAGVGLAELVQPAGETVDGGLVRHADGEGVEAGGGAGAVRIEAQAEVRPSGRMG